LETTTTTIREVARRANVSTATVSRYLAGRPIRNREAVEAAIAECNFVPRRYARSLRLGRSDMVGVVVPDLTNPYFAALMIGIETVMKAADLKLLWVNAAESQTIEREALSALLGYVDGLIIAPVCETDDLPELAARTGTKVVLVDRLVHGSRHFDWVTVDNFAGSHMAAMHLIRAGLTNLAIIAGPLDSTPGRERLEGFLSACNEEAITVHPDNIIIADFSESGGYTAMARLLLTLKLPGAVFCCNNLMTIGALRCINEKGVDIPGEISIVGFDDFPLADVVKPGITVISRPAEEQGKLAGHLMVERLRRGNTSTEKRQITLPTTLVSRGSVRTCPTHVSRVDKRA